MEAAADLREKHATRRVQPGVLGTKGQGWPLCVVCTAWAAWAAICERDIGVFWLDGPAPAAYRSQTLPPEKLSPLANRRNASPDSHSCSTVVPCSYFSPFLFFRLLLVAASTMSSADAKPLPFVYQFAAGKSQCRVPVELRAVDISTCPWDGRWNRNCLQLPRRLVFGALEKPPLM